MITQEPHRHLGQLDAALQVRLADLLQGGIGPEKADRHLGIPGEYELHGNIAIGVFNFQRSQRVFIHHGLARGPENGNNEGLGPFRRLEGVLRPGQIPIRGGVQGFQLIGWEGAVIVAVQQLDLLADGPVFLQVPAYHLLHAVHGG